MKETVSIIGVTFKTITGMEPNSDEVTFVAEDGREFRMFHSQDCCEHVSLNEVIGDVADLIGSPIVSYECVSNSEGQPLDKYDESFTWTFYKFQSQKGHVTLRWYGTSNGWYSENVDFVLIDRRKSEWASTEVA